MKEQEYKWLITKDAFVAIRNIVESAGFEAIEHFIQMNYYYDTDELDYKNKGITVRVRQKDDILEGMIKKHFNTRSRFISEESSWQVLSLPAQIYLDNNLLILQGYLTTERTKITLSHGVFLCMDKSSYFGFSDYEIELEYISGCRRMADDWKLTLDKYICKVLHLDTPEIKNENCKTKSERFFLEKEKLSRRTIKLCERSKEYGYFPIE